MKLSKKEFVFHAITCLVLLGFTGVALELGARYLVYRQGIYLKYIDRDLFFKLSVQDPGYKFPKDFHLMDKRYGWKHTPDNHGMFRGWRYPIAEFRNEVYINASGFRDTRPYVVEQDKVRIAVLGDSFIQALQVGQNETLPALLEADLAKRGLNPRVYNFGVSSIGTIHQYRIFQEEVLPLKPDVVIVAFFPNDLVDDSPHYKHERPQLTPRYEYDAQQKVVIHDFDLPSQDGMLVVRRTDLKKSPGLERAARIVDLARALSKRFPRLKSLEFLKLHLIDRFGLRTDYDYPFDVYLKEYPPQLEESLQVTTRLMEQFQNDCRANGITFVVVLLPAREQVLPQYWKEHVRQRRYILTQDQFDLQKPTQLLREFLDEKHIPYVDAMPVFQASPQKNKLYYTFDHHFTALGQKKVEELVAQYLLDHRSGFGKK